ncbi:Hypothetical_protein [Hexamita inflata]|uniref:Hypothetical_protein n=1 Tax=Hexamita inflata TaxID=28002 RepID=A0AA86P3P0_9EUKA|nr:Hypothetical protein HINF_LOCUS17212 [Hexamita inflata]
MTEDLIHHHNRILSIVNENVQFNHPLQDFIPEFIQFNIIFTNTYQSQGRQYHPLAFRVNQTMLTKDLKLRQSYIYKLNTDLKAIVEKVKFNKNICDNQRQKLNQRIANVEKTYKSNYIEQENNRLSTEFADKQQLFSEIFNINKENNNDKEKLEELRQKLLQSAQDFQEIKSSQLQVITNAKQISIKHQTDLRDQLNQLKQIFNDQYKSRTNIVEQNNKLRLMLENTLTDMRNLQLSLNESLKGIQTEHVELHNMYKIQHSFLDNSIQLDKMQSQEERDFAIKYLEDSKFNDELDEKISVIMRERDTVIKSNHNMQNQIYQLQHDILRLQTHIKASENQLEKQLINTVEHQKQQIKDLESKLGSTIIASSISFPELRLKSSMSVGINNKSFSTKAIQ